MQFRPDGSAGLLKDSFGEFQGLVEVRQIELQLSEDDLVCFSELRSATVHDTEPLRSQSSLKRVFVSLASSNGPNEFPDARGDMMWETGLTHVLLRRGLTARA